METKAASYNRYPLTKIASEVVGGTVLRCVAPWQGWQAQGGDYGGVLAGILCAKFIMARLPGASLLLAACLAYAILAAPCAVGTHISDIMIVGAGQVDFRRWNAAAFMAAMYCMPLSIFRDSCKAF